MEQGLEVAILHAKRAGDLVQGEILTSLACPLSEIPPAIHRFQNLDLDFYLVAPLPASRLAERLGRPWEGVKVSESVKSEGCPWTLHTSTEPAQGFLDVLDGVGRDDHTNGENLVS